MCHNRSTAVAPTSRHPPSKPSSTRRQSRCFNLLRNIMTHFYLSIRVYTCYMNMCICLYVYIQDKCHIDVRIMTHTYLSIRVFTCNIHMCGIHHQTPPLPDARAGVAGLLLHRLTVKGCFCTSMVTRPGGFVPGWGLDWACLVIRPVPV